MNQCVQQETVAAALLESCRRQGVRIATAESCTGGLIGAALTAVPGSSDVFEGGILAYQNRVKETLLGVSSQVLATEGAVSCTCARQMAEGAMRALRTELAMASTGIAGPGGATETKPVGLVYIGIAWRDRNGTVCSRASENRFGGNRDAVRAQTVATALEMAQRCLQEREN